MCTYRCSIKFLLLSSLLKVHINTETHITFHQIYCNIFKVGADFSSVIIKSSILLPHNYVENSDKVVII